CDAGSAVPSCKGADTDGVVTAGAVVPDGAAGAAGIAMTGTSGRARGGAGRAAGNGAAPSARSGGARSGSAFAAALPSTAGASAGPLSAGRDGGVGRTSAGSCGFSRRALSICRVSPRRSSADRPSPCGARSVKSSDDEGARETWTAYSTDATTPLAIKPGTTISRNFDGNRPRLVPAGSIAAIPPRRVLQPRVSGNLVFAPFYPSYLAFPT